MRKILEGLSLFRRLAYPRHQDLFERLARNQSPQALFITCADSRVVPNLIVQADPGDLFIVRNAGNIVPPAGQGGEGVVASIEYAVEALGVRDVIVCGHSNCGAMKGILHPEAVATMPTVAAWVRHGQAAREAVERLHPDADDHERLERMAEQNVIAQVRNLMTHAFVRRLIEAGELELYGWVYDIESGAVRGLDESGTNFVPVEGEEKGSPDEQAVLAALDADEATWGKIG
jgi:carbonic anhydrase